MRENGFKRGLLAWMMLIAVGLVMMGVTVNTAKAETVSFDIEGYEDYDEVLEVLRLTNEIRAAAGVAPLALDASLMDIAVLRSGEVGFYYSHTRPNGSDCFSVFASAYVTAAENIAIGYYDASSVVNGWKNSSGHYTNMVNPTYTRIGIGCFYQENGKKAWVQMFSTGTANVPSVSGKVLQSFPIETTPEKIKLGVSNIDKLYEKETKQSSVILVNTGYSDAHISVPLSEVTFSSADPSIVSVDANGVFTGVSVGTTTVTVTFQKYPAVSVSQEVSVWSKTEGNPKVQFEVIPDSTELVYNGKRQICGVTVKDGDKVLISSRDYGVDYGNVYNAGELKITVTGYGDYKGKTKVIYKTIARRDISNLTPEITVDSLTNEVKVTLRDPEVRTLVLNSDYTVTKQKAGANLLTVTLTGQGNFTGTIVRTIEWTEKTQPVEEDPVKDDDNENEDVTPSLQPVQTGSLTFGKKWVKLTWAKQADASGYQVVIAKNKKFTLQKSTFRLDSGKNAKKIKGLNRKTKYYVKVRAYVKNGSKAEYGKWSRVLIGKTK